MRLLRHLAHQAGLDRSVREAACKEITLSPLLHHRVVASYELHSTRRDCCHPMYLFERPRPLVDRRRCDNESVCPDVRDHSRFELVVDGQGVVVARHVGVEGEGELCRTCSERAPLEAAHSRHSSPGCTPNSTSARSPETRELALSAEPCWAATWRPPLIRSEG